MRYSNRAQSAIRLATQEAARLDHEHVSTGHLLLGIMREGEGAAITFLRGANVDLEKMRSELESIMENKGRGSVVGRIKLTDRANNALKLAAEESEKMGHKYVGTEHLLVGILRERDGVASKALARSGVTLIMARSAAKAIAVDEEDHSETLTFQNVEITTPMQDASIDYGVSIPREVLDLEEASQLLRITVDDLKKLLKTEDLPARMLGNQWRFSRAALIRWLGEGSSLKYPDV